MSDQALSTLDDHLAWLVSRQKDVLQNGAKGGYGPETIAAAIRATVEHIAVLSAIDEEVSDDE